MLCSASVLTGAKAVPIACAKSQELAAKMQARAKPGTTVSYDLDALNFSFGSEALEEVSMNALSKGGLTMLFSAHVAGAQQPAQQEAKALADSGATHCYVAESFVKAHLHKFEMVPLSASLRLATGSSAKTVGLCTSNVNIQSYTVSVQAFVVRMNTDFDLILGQNWCKANGVDILYTQSCLMMSHCTTDGSSHKLICDAAEFDSCSIVSAAELKNHLQEGDRMVICMIRPSSDDADSVSQTDVPDVMNPIAASSEAGASSEVDAQLRAVLDAYKDVFPAELPSKLPPDRTVFHTIPLKEGAEPPPRRAYRLSRPERDEIDKQGQGLIGQGLHSA